MFKADLQQRQPELDEVMKVAAKRRLHIGRHQDNFANISGNKGILYEEDEGKDEVIFIYFKYFLKENTIISLKEAGLYFIRVNNLIEALYHVTGINNRRVRKIDVIN